MFLLIAIAFLLKRNGTQAVPLPAPTPTSSTFAAPIFPRNDLADGCNSRTVLDILWSCLATTFACTWVSVHPNVPFKGEGKWTLLRRRIFLMFFSILAPEFMIVWAFKQWRGAVIIREAVNDAIKNLPPDSRNRIRTPWTTTHGHLLQMGGFRLIATQRENLFYKGLGPVLRSLLVLNIHQGSEWSKFIAINNSRSEDLIPKEYYYRNQTSEGSWATDCTPDNELNDNIWEGVLTINSLKQLLFENLIHFPAITEDEINDKSKGDALSKGIALLQLTWFIVQIITRAVQGLSITELELTTAALAGLNGIMYIFWWSKPRAVRFPVVIRTKRVEKLLTERADDSTWSFSDQEFDFRKYFWTSMTTPIKKVLSDLRRFLVSFPKMIKNVPFKLFSPIIVLLQPLRSYLSQFYRYFLRTIRESRGGKSVEPTRTREAESSDAAVVVNSVVPHSARENMSRIQQICQAVISCAMIAVYCFLLLYSLLAYIINFVLFVPMVQILGKDVDDGSFLAMLFDTDEQVRVFSMMFYSENAEAKSLFKTASIAGALFGGVHCLAWHFNFPSHVEQIMWRTASLGVVGACALPFVGICTAKYIDYGQFPLLMLVLPQIIIAVAYPVFRLMLLVIAVISLRSLPPSAFDTVQWVEFFPHI